MAAYIEPYKWFYVRCYLTKIYHLEMAAYIEMQNFFYVSCHLTYTSIYIIGQCKVSPHIEIAKLSGSQIKSWVALCFLVVRLVVRPDRWHLHLSQLYDVLDHRNHTWCMCGGIWWCLDHIWWCLVVSGACLVVSGVRLVMLRDIDWYDLIWCIYTYMGRYIFQCL